MKKWTIFTIKRRLQCQLLKLCLAGTKSRNLEIPSQSRIQQKSNQNEPNSNSDYFGWQNVRRLQFLAVFRRPSNGVGGGPSSVGLGYRWFSAPCEEEEVRVRDPSLGPDFTRWIGVQEEGLVSLQSQNRCVFGSLVLAEALFVSGSAFRELKKCFFFFFELFACFRIFI